jgi:hypothetical protein
MTADWAAVASAGETLDRRGERFDVIDARLDQNGQQPCWADDGPAGLARGGLSLCRVSRHTSVYLGRCDLSPWRFARLWAAEGTANAVRVRALPGFKSPSLRS